MQALMPVRAHRHMHTPMRIFGSHRDTSCNVKMGSVCQGGAIQRLLQTFVATAAGRVLASESNAIMEASCPGCVKASNSKPSPFESSISVVSADSNCHAWLFCYICDPMVFGKFPFSGPLQEPRGRNAICLDSSFAACCGNALRCQLPQCTQCVVRCCSGGCSCIFAQSGPQDQQEERGGPAAMLRLLVCR